MTHNRVYSVEVTPVKVVGNELTSCLRSELEPIEIYIYFIAEEH